MPKYDRDESTGEIIQFSDPQQKEGSGGADTARSATVMDPQNDQLQQNAAGAFRKQVLGDTSFTKEELALKSIRDEAKQDQEGNSAQNSNGEDRKVPNSYQKHVDELNRS